MTTIGFNSKRQASLDTLDHIGYQGRESRPEELAPKPVESFYSLEMRPAGEGMSHGPNPWREAIEAELICLHLGTVDSFLDAKAALNALIDWHVAVALDPEVSSDAQALIDRGAAAPVPAVPDQRVSVAYNMTVPLPSNPEHCYVWTEAEKVVIHAHAAAVSAAECAPLMTEIEALRQDGSKLVAERDALLNNIHSCHPGCTRAGCVNAVLREALRGVLPWVVTQEVACSGLKCREAVCMSCSYDSEVNVQRACDAYAAAEGALKRLD